MRPADLVTPLGDRLHGSLYTDPVVFASELERIWYRGWVYVGHESEIPRPGDYLTTQIGLQPVIMTRSEAGMVSVLMNRCSHRGNKLCTTRAGNAPTFRCPYHGWTFANTGALTGIPYPQRYANALSRKEHGLQRAPRVESHRGFVFASLAAEGKSLTEHLGLARESLDRLADLSPAGEVELSAGWLRHRVRANWKMTLENQVDGYHPRFVHESLFQVADYQVSDLCSAKSASRAVDLGQGHTELDFRPAYRETGELFTWFGGASADRFSGYTDLMRQTYGPERARDILRDGPPHVMVFPNLFLGEMTVAVIQPVSVSETRLLQTAVMLKDAPEINKRSLRQCEGAMGPAGLLISDDVEMMERNQAGLAASGPEWITLTRGLHDERAEPGGVTSGNVTDETALRGFWTHYRKLMSAQNGAAFDGR